VNKSLGVVALLMGLLLSGQAMAEDKQSSYSSEEYEMDSWTSARDINTVEAYEVYLAEYANGRHAKFAQAAINKIKKGERSQEPETTGTHPANQNGASATKPLAAPAPQAIPATDSTAVQKPAPAVTSPAAAATMPVASTTPVVTTPAAPASIPTSVDEKARAQ